MKAILRMDRLAWVVLVLMVWSGKVSLEAVDVLPERQPGAKQRNVIFILSDDHRYDAMGFMGHSFLETPHMDSLAANGVHLKNAFVTTSLCSPSRASILTGLYTHKHRVIDNNRLVPEGTRFFPEWLQKAGYQTAYIGKWHMGGDSDEPRPGFDHWVSFRGQGHYLPPGPNYTLNVNGDRVKQKGYITDELTDYAVEWLEEQQSSDRPFFLYLSHKAVHANFTPAERHEGRYTNAPFKKPASEALTQENYEGKPRWLRDQRNSWHGVDFPYHSSLDVERYYKRYCESLLAVDDSIGRVLAQLKAMGLYEETLVIYMGDNGFMFGEHGLIDKRVAYETSIRVPMLMQCPELFSGGRAVEQVVANIDVGPTIMQACGLKRPGHMDGRSFIPLAQGRRIGWREYFLYVYYWEKNFPQSPTVFCLRGDQYKYITYYGLWDTDELYDIQADPGEKNNLIADPQFRPIAQKMENALYAALEDEGGMFIPLNQPRGNSQNKRLGTRGGKVAGGVPRPHGCRRANQPECSLENTGLRSRSTMTDHSNPEGSEEEIPFEGPIEFPITDELDLHPFRPKEVKDVVPDYLEACREKGILSVRVVHGKGIGNLRRTVHSVLDRLEFVESFCPASELMGGWGATMVQLRPSPEEAGDDAQD